LVTLRDDGALHSVNGIGCCVAGVDDADITAPDCVLVRARVWLAVLVAVVPGEVQHTMDMSVTDV
jgi:hypothetical protein